MAIEIKINKPVLTLNSLSFYIRGEKKIGKTTLFKNVVDVLYKGDVSKGLLVGVGNEVGYKAISNLQTTQVKTWKELEELKAFLIKEKGKNHNIEMVCFDTADEWIPIAEKEVRRLSQVKTKKPCESINSAFGGFGKGQDSLCEIIKKYISDLTDAGIGVWVIAHTKDKTIKEKGMNEDEGYQILTSSLSNKYEGLFGDMFDMVITCYKDKNIVDGRIQKTVRKFAFRGTSFVDAGCRIGGAFLPDEIEFAETEKETAELFVNTLTEALRKNADMDENTYNEESKKELENLSEKHKASKSVTTAEEKETEDDKESFDDKTALSKVKKVALKNKAVKDKVMKYLSSKEKGITDLNKDEIFELYNMLGLE